MTVTVIMTRSNPPPRNTLPEIHRLPIRVAGPGGKGLLVDCPRRDAEVLVDRCTLCAACTGLSLRDRYLVCTGDPDGHENEATEPPREADAPLAPEAQALRRGGRIGWLGAELLLLEGLVEGKLGDA